MNKMESTVIRFPSLDNSPLWAEDVVVHRPVEKEQTPPLQIIRDSYPRIAKAIELMWGTQEMDLYFSRLVMNDRDDRAGFPPTVLAAILKLSADHCNRFCLQAVDQRDDGWGHDRFSKHAFAA